MQGSRYKWEKHLSRFALFRSVAWVFAITVVVSNNTLPDYGAKKMLPAIYQFYALFCIFAYVQVMEGLKYVSRICRKLKKALIDFLSGNIQRNALLLARLSSVSDFQHHSCFLARNQYSGFTKLFRSIQSVRSVCASHQLNVAICESLHIQNNESEIFGV